MRFKTCSSNCEQGPIDQWQFRWPSEAPQSETELATETKIDALVNYLKFHPVEVIILELKEQLKEVSYD